MTSDALLQLGMGPVEPGAAQTEGFLRSRPAKAREVSFLAHAAGAAFVARRPASRFPSRYRSGAAEAPEAPEPL